MCFFCFAIPMAPFVQQVVGQDHPRSLGKVMNDPYYESVSRYLAGFIYLRARPSPTGRSFFSKTISDNNALVLAVLNPRYLASSEVEDAPHF